MSKTPLSKKLRLQVGQTALTLNAPAGYRDLIGTMPDKVHFSVEADCPCDFVHLFVSSMSELEAWIDRAMDAVKHDALLWISYPKGGSGVETDLNRDRIWKKLLPKGIRPVSQVSVDDTWSAIRFRPTEEVGK